MLALALVTLVAAAPAAAPAPRLLVMDLKADKGVDPQTASTLTDFLAAWVGESKKFSVTSKRELTTLADLEAQRQEADCEASDVCVSDLADALGARFVVFGRVGKLGASYFVHVTLADAKGEVPSDRRVVQAASVDDLAVELHNAARSMTGLMPLPKPRTSAPATTTPTLDPPKTKPAPSLDPPKPTTPTTPTTPKPEQPVRSVRGYDDDPPDGTPAPKKARPTLARDVELTAAQKRQRERRAEALALRAGATDLSTAGAAVGAGGVVIGSALAATGLLALNNQSAQPIALIGGGGVAVVGLVAAGVLFGQASAKNAEADEIDPTGRQ